MKANTVQVYLDQQTASYKRLELEQEKTVAMVSNFEQHMKEMVNFYVIDC